MPLAPHGRCRARIRTLAAAALGIAIGAAPRRCLADDQQAFELAKNPFDGGQYAEAHARLATLLDPTLPTCDAVPGASGRCRVVDPELIERARALDAASLLALKRDAEADAQIARIFRANPQYAPNPAMFPQEVIDRFSVVRGGLRAELEALAQQKAREELAKRVAAQKAREADERWIAELQRLAGEERVVEPNSRWVAMVPFGVGQYQNGDIRLGVVFTVGEALLGGSALISVAVYNKLASTDLTQHPNNMRVDVPKLNQQIITAATVNQICFAGWAALSAAGVVQAQVAFVPERVTFRKRPVPPRPTVTPVAAPLPGGAVLGLTGTF
jgi:hypothetical protein